MHRFLYRFCPFIIPMILCMIIYLKIDKNKKITKKINSLIKCKDEYKSFYLFIIMLLAIAIVGFIGSFADLPNFILNIVCGAFTGFDIIITSRIENK